MTLILFIPYAEGCILMGDRQNSHLRDPEGYKDEISKVHLHGANGPAIGCAGHSYFIEVLYNRLKDDQEITNENICGKIKKNILPKVISDFHETVRYTSLYANTYTSDVEMIVLTKNETRIVPIHLYGFIDMKIDPAHIFAVPRENRGIKKYLEIDSCGFSENQAISLGEELLRQVAFFNFTVGPPEYHGCDLVRVRNGEFLVQYKQSILTRKTPSEVVNDISRID